MYRSIFIDLDDTVWAFTENARDTFQDMYDKYHFDRYFRVSIRRNAPFTL